MIELKGISKSYPQPGGGEIPILREISLKVQAGESLVVTGPSGSGKSTLLNLLGGMDRPDAGHVWYRDTDLTALSDDRLTTYRRESIGFIFQFYNLVPTLTAYENVQAAAELVDDPLDISHCLELVELADRADHFPAQLSGGEQQRVAIARALVKQPELLLADEPTGALDLETARKVLSILQQLNRSRDLTTVLITHNPALAAIAHRTIRLVSGRIAETRVNEQPIAAGEVVW